MDVFSHATELTDELAATVAALEIHCAQVFARPVLDSEQLQQAIRLTWPRVITDAQNGNVSPHVDYVAALYDRLAEEMLLADSGVFTDRTDIPWEEYYTAGCGDEPRCEDAWVIAELFWGGYIKYLHLTLGWLLMNAIRIQQDLPAITPTPDSTPRFTDDLRWSGPDVFDAESLRGLFYEYERQNAG
jgi:hypothetical protein